MLVINVVFLCFIFSSVELGNVQKFQQRQKVIEEANKRKRALLAKAIDDR